MRFIVDEMLGRLARWLRVLGFDAECPPTTTDSELVRRSVAEDRVLLTRDRELSRCGALRRVILIRSVRLSDQLSQVLSELSLSVEESRLFSRCLLCNAPVEPLPRSQARGNVPAYVFETQSDFHRCPHCDRIYWPGTHWQHVLDRLRLERVVSAG